MKIRIIQFSIIAISVIQYIASVYISVNYVDMRLYHRFSIIDKRVHEIRSSPVLLVLL